MVAMSIPGVVLVLVMTGVALYFDGLWRVYVKRL